LWPGFRRLGCHFIVTGGKTNTSRPLAIARELRIRAFVVFDCDRTRAGVFCSQPTLPIYASPPRRAREQRMRPRDAFWVRRSNPPTNVMQASMRIRIASSTTSGALHLERAGCLDRASVDAGFQPDNGCKMGPTGRHHLTSARLFQPEHGPTSIKVTLCYLDRQLRSSRQSNAQQQHLVFLPPVVSIIKGRLHHAPGGRDFENPCCPDDFLPGRCIIRITELRNWGS